MAQALTYLLFYIGRRRVPRRILENNAVENFVGNYPNSALYQFLHRIHDTRIAIWSQRLQEFRNNSAAQDKSLNKRSPGITKSGDAAIGSVQPEWDLPRPINLA